MLRLGGFAFVRSRVGGARRIASCWTEPRSHALWGFDDWHLSPTGIYRGVPGSCNCFPCAGRPARGSSRGMGRRQRGPSPGSSVLGAHAVRGNANGALHRRGPASGPAWLRAVLPGRRRRRLGRGQLAIDQPSAAARGAAARLSRRQRGCLGIRQGRSHVGHQQQTPAHVQPDLTMAIGQCCRFWLRPRRHNRRDYSINCANWL